MNTFNPYANPYIIQPPLQPQNTSGLMPVFQDISQQQAMQNAALAQQNQQVNQAAQTSGGGINPMALAQMLRKDSNPYSNAQTAMQQYGAGNVYGYGGMGQVPTTTTGMD